MPIVLDPSQNFITIDLLYIDKERHMQMDNGEIRVLETYHHFIQDAAELQDLLSKGYYYEEELEKKGQNYYPNKPQNEEKEIKRDPKKVIYKLQTAWKRISWKESNIINSYALTKERNEDGEFSFSIDLFKYRDIKLKTCLKQWNLKNEKGQVMNVSPDVIDALPPAVAEELVKAFDKVTEPGEDDLKN